MEIINLAFGLFNRKKRKKKEKNKKSREGHGYKTLQLTLRKFNNSKIP